MQRKPILPGEEAMMATCCIYFLNCRKFCRSRISTLRAGQRKRGILPCKPLLENPSEEIPSSNKLQAKRSFSCAGDFEILLWGCERAWAFRMKLMELQMENSRARFSMKKKSRRALQYVSFLAAHSNAETYVNRQELQCYWYWIRAHERFDLKDWKIATSATDCAESICRALLNDHCSSAALEQFLDDISHLKKLLKVRSATPSSENPKSSHIDKLAVELGFISLKGLSLDTPKSAPVESLPKQHIINWAGFELKLVDNLLLMFDKFLLSPDSSGQNLKGWKRISPHPKMDTHMLEFLQFQKLCAKLALSQSRALALFGQLEKIFTIRGNSRQKKLLWTIRGSIEEVVRIYEEIRSPAVAPIHSNQIFNSAIDSRTCLFKAIKQLLNSYFFALQAGHSKPAVKQNPSKSSLLATAARALLDMKEALPELESNLLILENSLDVLRVGCLFFILVS